MLSAPVESGIKKTGIKTEKKTSWISWIPIAAAILYSLFNICFIGYGGNFPLNDDAFYAIPVRDLIETGILKLDASIAACYLHILWGFLWSAIFGFSYEILRISTLLFSLAGVWAVFLLTREIGLNRARAGLFALVFAVNPLVVNLSYSFMTDIPFTTLTIFHLYFLIRGIKSGSTKTIATAALFLAASILVRQINILLLLPNLILLLYTTILKRLDSGTIIRQATWLLGLPATALLIYRTANRMLLDNSAYMEILGERLKDKALNIFGSHSWQALTAYNEQLIHCIFYLGLFFLPLLVVIPVAIEKIGRSRGRSLVVSVASAMIIAVLLNAVLQDKDLMPYNMNLLRFPALGPHTVIGQSLPEAESWQMLLLTALTSAGAWLYITCLGLLSLPGAKEEPHFSLQKAYLTFALSTMTIFTCTLLQVKGFDRYYLTLVPYGLVCIALAWKNWNLKPGWFATLLMGSLIACTALWSSCAQQHYMSWNRARWTAIELLKAKGINPDRIEGGAEYRHVDKLILRSVTDRKNKTVTIQEKWKGRAPQNQWRWWPVRGDDYLISHVPTEHYVTEFTVPYWSSLLWSNGKIYVQKRVENF